MRIGRSEDADVQVMAPSVSRHHAELRSTAAGWVLADAGGRLGTFVAGDRVGERPLDDPVDVRLGPEERATWLRVVPLGPDDLSGDGSAGLAETTTFAAVTRGGPDGPVARTGPDLLVVVEGREHRFTHPDEISVGRRADCRVVLDDPHCSRLHGVVTAAGAGWVWTDLSSVGTWREGRSVQRHEVTGVVELRLGHPTAGVVVRLTPVLSAAEEEQRLAGDRRRHRIRSVVAVLGLAALLAVLVATVSFGLLRLGGESSPPTPRAEPERRGTASPGRLDAAELDAAKLATVRLSATTSDASGASVTYSGSGTLIDPRGLILTNAHVAAPATPGLEDVFAAGPDSEALEDPDYLLVATVPGPDDSPAAPAYRARVVEADGTLDAAVLEIYARSDGSPLVDALDLPWLPLGDSDALRTGDDVTVLGFPTISGSGAVSVTRGVISTFLDDPVLGPRSEIDTDARIAPGNSGGAAIDDQARIVGIPSAVYVVEGTAVVSGRIRPVSAVAGLVEQARAQADATSASP